MAGLVGTLGGSSGTMKRTIGSGIFTLPPAINAGTSVQSSGSANTYGAWVNLLGSALDDLYIVGIVDSGPNHTVTYSMYQVATGAGGSEVVRGTLKQGRAEASVRPGVVMLPIPIFIAEGERVSVRVADSVASADSHLITLLCVPAADLENF